MYRRTIVQHQGITEKVLGVELQNRGVSVHRPFELLHYAYTNSRTHPIRASIKNHVSGEVESWDCKYMVAADGRKPHQRARWHRFCHQRHRSDLGSGPLRGRDGLPRPSTSLSYPNEPWQSHAHPITTQDAAHIHALEPRRDRGTKQQYLRGRARRYQP